MNNSLHERLGREGNKFMRAVFLVMAERVLRPEATEEELKQIAKNALCDLCSKNVPIENGNHIVLGTAVPCEAGSR